MTLYCGHARLLSKILGRDENRIKRQLGLPAWIRRKTCKHCGKKLTEIQIYVNRTYCSNKCRAEVQKDNSKVLAICDECGKPFILARGELLGRLSRKSRTRKVDKLFCSRQCWGHYIGEHYGFRKGSEHGVY